MLEASLAGAHNDKKLQSRVAQLEAENLLLTDELGTIEGYLGTVADQKKGKTLGPIQKYVL